MKPCVLHVKDEVNVKIEGLDLDTRRKLSNLFKYEIPGARYMPAVRLGRWDGKMAYFQMGGSTYINLLPDILPILNSQGYDVSLNDQRDYVIDMPLHSVDDNTFALKFKRHLIDGTNFGYLDLVILNCLKDDLGLVQAIEDRDIGFLKLRYPQK